MFNALLGCYAAALAESAHRKGEFLTSTAPLWTSDCSLNQDAVTAAAMGTVCYEIYMKDQKLSLTDDELKQIIISRFRKLCVEIKGVHYTEKFNTWLQSDFPQPFNSRGAGAALRAIGPALLFDQLTSSLRLAKLCAAITHNHPQGINGALAMTILLKCLLFKMDIFEIKEYISKHFMYDMEKTYDEWVEIPPVKATCMECIPAAFAAFENSNSFDEAISNAFNLNGPRIIAALTGALAMTFYKKSSAGLNWAVAVLSSINSKETKDLCQGIIDIPKQKAEEYSNKNLIQQQLLNALEFKECLLKTIPFIEK